MLDGVGSARGRKDWGKCVGFATREDGQMMWENVIASYV